MGKLLKEARKAVKDEKGWATEGSPFYIDQQLRYYGIAERPEELSDMDWALRYAVLEDIRAKEKEIIEATGRLNQLR